MGTATSQPHAPPQPDPPPPPEPATFTCEICIEPLPASEKFRSNTPLCSHPFCTDCVAKYIAVQVADHSSSDVSCPSPACRVALDPLACRPHLPPAVFALWCDNLCERIVLALDRCYCPNRECSAVVVSECGGEVRRAACPACGTLFCFRCGVTWHAGYGCDENDGGDENDVAFGVLAEERKWRRCPRCRHCVELVEGCSIVKCRCGTNFCYKCGRKVKQHWCDCDRAMMWRVTCMRIFFILLFFVFSGAAYKFTQCGTNFCYKCGRTVKQHWCDCDRTMMWRVVCVRIFILTVIFLQFIFLFGAVYKLAH